MVAIFTGWGKSPFELSDCKKLFIEILELAGLRLRPSKCYFSDWNHANPQARFQCGHSTILYCLKDIPWPTLGFSHFYQSAQMVLYTISTYSFTSKAIEIDGSRGESPYYYYIFYDPLWIMGCKSSKNFTDLELHLQAEKALSNFFSVDCIKYKRLWSIYIVDMRDYPTTG